MMRAPQRLGRGLARLAVAASWLFACGTGGSTWVPEPFRGATPGGPEPLPLPARHASSAPSKPSVRRILGEPDPLQAQKAAVARGLTGGGRPVGVFRNTYYDFPQEAHYGGEPVALFDAACRQIASVPLGFHDAVCMQGSGLLLSGRTVSFARRDCRCARLCPRSGQQICFEALDMSAFPWGRGALGQAIVPLLTVAVDSDVIPLGTPLFVPEYVGLPRDPQGSSEHDGCFIAQDRGVKVRGQHLDIFTGEETVTLLWNQLVPSNRGVTVVLDSPFCQR